MKIRLVPLALLAGLATFLASGAVALGGATTTEYAPGLDRLDSVDARVAVIRGIATFDAVPTTANTAALQALGLTVQPMKHLPLALVRGTVQQMQAAVVSGAANDVYRTIRSSSSTRRLPIPSARRSHARTATPARA